MKRVFLALLFVFFIKLISAQYKFTRYVNPFIGTGGHGHTYPGAVAPHGMVQLSPDTRLEGWDGCSGYHYSDSFIYGFTHTHLSGTGCSDYGDILLMPGNGIASPNRDLYKSPFSHQKEKAAPGYYSVHLDRNDIDAAFTVTERVGFHQYHFNNTNDRFILLDLQHRDEVLASSLRRINDSTFSGLRRSKAWAEDQYVFFVIQFSKRVSKMILFQNDQIANEQILNEGKDIKAVFRFSDGNDNIIVKVAISPVSEEGALNNLKQEGSLTFEKAKIMADQLWNQELSKIDIENSDENKMTIFYTALYHTMIVPNINMDVDGKYRGRDNQIHQTNGFTYYSVFSLWDTYRAAHPLYTLIDQKRTVDYIKTFLTQYQQGGRLPIWELSSNETDCMIGNHSISVIADAFMKGIGGYDSLLALKAMVDASNWDHEGMDSYIKKGAVNVEDDHESVSKTVEYAYDDYCVGAMAEKLGDISTALEFYKRAQNYKNVWDNQAGFMRPIVNGGWLHPFDPREVNNHFTEANSWQYSFYVPQDIGGYLQLIGGADSLEKKLDALFNAPEKTTGREQSDITGLIGQYAHGNEPSHHIIYLYNYTNHPWKTQYYASKVMNEFYKNTPDGLIGNEDCGQMSAWYVLSSLGFYPVAPGKNNYLIGSPQHKQAILQYENGRTLQIFAHGVDSTNKFISKASWGIIGVKGVHPLKNPILPHEDLVKGGILMFDLGDKKEIEFFKQPVIETSLDILTKIIFKKNKNNSDIKLDVNNEIIEKSDFVTNPVIEGDGPVFKDKMIISIKNRQPGTRIFYTLNGTEPNERSFLYHTPFEIDSSVTINAIAVEKLRKKSAIVTAHFFKNTKNWKVTINAPLLSQYTAGGGQGLVDGIRGNLNWRTGNWQGYQTQNMDVTVDLNEEKKIHSVSIGFLQDVRSWIVMPKQIKVYVSIDGKKYEDIYIGSNFLNIDNPNVEIKNVTAKFSERLVRYIKVIAEQYGSLPSWHPGAGGDSIIFTDEIDVE